LVTCIGLDCLPSPHFPVMLYSIPVPRPDKSSILAKMSEMRTAGDVPVNVDEFVKVAASAVMEDRKRLLVPKPVPDRAMLLARMAILRATDNAPVHSDVLVTRAIASLEAKLLEDAVTPIAVLTPTAVIMPIAVVAPIIDRRLLSLPMRPGDLYASKSIAAGSQRKYECSWYKWTKFASDRGWTSLPSEADSLEAFLVDLANSSGSVAAVDSAIAAVGFFTSLQGLSTLFESPRLKRVIQGIHSECDKRPVPRAPFAADDVRKMMDKARETSDLSLWRAAATVVLCFNDCA
jgi:hypothetical protein